MPNVRDLRVSVRSRVRATGEPYALALSRVVASESSGDHDVPDWLGEVLRTCRTRRGWSVSAAAEQLGVSKLKLDLLERGCAQVDSTLGSRLAQVYAFDAATTRVLRRLAALHDLSAESPEPRPGLVSSWGGAPLLWVATLGRRTRVWRPKWWNTFVVDGDVAYVIETEGGRADWYRNLQTHRDARVWIEGEVPRSAVGEEVTSDGEWRRVAALISARYPDDRYLVETGSPVAFRVPPPA